MQSENHKLIVKHSCIIVNNYTFGDAPKLESQFSVWENFTSYYFGIYYDVENKRLYLPRGIDIWYVEKQLGVSAYIDTKCNNYKPFNEQVLLYKQPRDDDQKTTLRFLLGKKEFEVTAKHSQLCINLTTGKGKSYCSIAAAAYEGYKFGVLTYSTDCLAQWRDYVMEYTNIPSKRICLVQGSIMIKRIIENDYADNFDIFLISHDTIKSYAESNGWDKITKLFEKLMIATLYIDEAHQNFVNITMVNFFTNIRKTIYVTATKAKSSKEQNKIYQLYFKNVLSIDLFDEDKDPHTAYKALMFNSHPTPSDISGCKNMYGLNRTKYIDYLTKKENFYMMLTIVLNISIKHNAKTLIYIGTNDAIKEVYEWINSNIRILKGNVGIYTTLTPKDRKKKELDNLIILSTTKSCGAAMDIKGLKMTIVAAEPFKSEVIAIQTLGRTRGKNTQYIELVDRGFYYTKKYYNEKKHVFDKYATSRTEINITDEDLAIRAEAILESLERRIPIIDWTPGQCYNPLVMLSDMVRKSDGLYNPLIMIGGK